MSLVVFDVDGTLTSEHVWKGLMAACQHQGIKTWTHRLYLLTHYPLYLARKLHLCEEMAFRRRWAAGLGWYLRGLTEAQAQALGDWIAEAYLRHRWRPELLKRLDDHRQRGHTVVLLSAAPHVIVQRIARHLGAHHGIGTRFLRQGGRYTGAVQPPVCLGEGKAARLISELQRSPEETAPKVAWAYADSITDLPILERAAHPVAVHPDGALSAIARHRGWEIIANDKTPA